MIKVESDMLVLDASFTKEDVEAINYFVALAEKRVEERIIKLLEAQEVGYWFDLEFREHLIALIKG